MMGGCITYSMAALYEGILVVDKANAGFNCKTDYDFKLQRDGTDVFLYDYGNDRFFFSKNVHCGVIYGTTLSSTGDVHGDTFSTGLFTVDGAGNLSAITLAAEDSSKIEGSAATNPLFTLYQTDATNGKTCLYLHQAKTSVSALQIGNAAGTGNILTVDETSGLIMTGFSVGLTGIITGLGLISTGVIDVDASVTSGNGLVDLYQTASGIGAKPVLYLRQARAQSNALQIINAAGDTSIFSIGESLGSNYGVNITLADAKNIILGSTTGSKIGTAATQKLGFYGATPVVQQTYTAVSNPPTQAEMTAIRDALVNMGLMAAS